MTRGQCGWLDLHCLGLAPFTTVPAYPGAYPNARGEPRPEAGARHERTLEGVGSSARLDAIQLVLEPGEFGLKRFLSFAWERVPRRADKHKGRVGCRRGLPTNAVERFHPNVIVDDKLCGVRDQVR